MTEPTLSQDAINSYWQEDSEPARRLREATKKGAEHFTAELDRQVTAHQVEEQLAKDLQKQYDALYGNLNMGKVRMQMAVRLGCQQMRFAHMKDQHVIGV